MWRTPKGLVIIASVAIVLLLIFIAFTSDISPNQKQDEVKQVEITSPVKLQVQLDETLRTNQFIIDRLPFEGGLFEMEHAPHGEIVTYDDLITDMMQLMYSAIAIKDVDALTVVFSIESVQSLLEDNQNPMEHQQEALENFLQLISREDTIKDMQYQLDRQIGYEDISNGQIYLSYSDGFEVEIPIQIKTIGDEDHRAFEIVTPLNEVEKQFVN